MNFLKNFVYKTELCTKFTMPKKHEISVARENAVLLDFSFFRSYPGDLFGADITYEGDYKYVVGHRSVDELIIELQRNL